jgi:hypothetical protein
MHIRVRMLTVTGILAAVAVASALGAPTQDKKAPKLDPKTEKALQVEAAAAAKMVDDVAAGQPAPDDYPFTWQYHTMKSRDGKVYVPFMLLFDKDKEKAPPAAFTYYVRVVNRAAGTENSKAVADAKSRAEKAAAVAKMDPENPQLQEMADKARAAVPRVEYAFEDVRMLEAGALAGGPPLSLQRAFAVAPGDYDVYFVIKQRVADAKDKKGTVKAGVLKTSITVPNYWSNDLMTSSVIISSKVDQLNQTPAGPDAAANPYAFGTIKVTPSVDGKFTKKDELAIFFYVYNAGVDKATNKPDVTIEYAFYQKTGATEKYFNKTQPAQLNATTLPPNFDVNAGHQLPGNIGVPLASFPEGDYRLEIKVTDKVTSKTKVENVSFSVSAS